MWDSPLYLSIKMLHFDNISGQKISQKFPQKTEITDNHLSLCKLIILDKNTCKIKIKIVKRQKTAECRKVHYTSK